jgi:AcrR family transcriptional regulator
MAGQLRAAATPAGGKRRVSRRERRRAEVRERLYSAALGLFAERGFLETTVEDITEAADVGKGTFFNYFPTKEHILAAYGSERLAPIEQAWETARAGERPAMEVLGELMIDLAGQSTKSPELLRSIYAAHASCAPVRAELQARMDHGWELLSRIIATGQQRGEIRKDLPARELGKIIQRVFMGITLSWSMNPDISLRKTAEMAWELILPGLQTKCTAANHRKRGRF